MRLQITAIPEPTRTLIAASLRRAMMEYHGHLVPDAPPNLRPEPDWTQQQWESFFVKAGWPQDDAKAFAADASPIAKNKKIPNPHFGILPTVRDLFKSGWQGTINELYVELPQWTELQLQSAVSRLSCGRSIIRKADGTWYNQTREK